MPNSFKNTEIGDLKGTIWLRKKIHIQTTISWEKT